MKRNVSLAVLLSLACLAVAGCAEGGGQGAVREATPERSEPVPANGAEEPRTSVVMAACARPVPVPEPSRAAPGEAFRVHGEGFTTDCYDTGQPGRPPPQQDILIDFRQGERAWRLATIDADPRGVLDAKLEVPEDAEAGNATVVVRTDDGLPAEAPFRVLDRPEAGGGPPGTGPPEGEVPVASGVAAACAGGGASVDLVAEGTVQRLRVGRDSSLAEIRLERVLRGDAGETVLVETGSGTGGGVAEDYVGFEEGGRYLLRLQRRGDVFTTNLCLGTERLE